jgi:hypothetical protein
MDEMRIQTKQKIKLMEQVNELPDEFQSEVMDFVGFLHEKYLKSKVMNQEDSHVPPKAGCMKGSFTWMSDDFNEPLEVFNDYQ